MSPLYDGTGYVAADVSLTVLMTLCAFLTYARVGFERKTMRFMVLRMILGIGWTIWAFRCWVAIITDFDLLIPPLTIIALGMITSSYSLIQILAIKRALLLSRNPIHCLQNPEYPCQREDRVQELEDR